LPAERVYCARVSLRLGSVPQTAIETPVARPAAPSRKVIIAAVLLIAGGAALLFDPFGWRQAVLYLVGAALGVVLYHSGFGFAAGWRAFIVEGRGEALRAQMAMLALATMLFFPVLNEGVLFGLNVAGAIAPVGISVAVGALLFGIGMQLGGACASGTLYTAGGGNARMLLTLAAFVAGAVIGTAHLPWWLERPSLGSVSLPEILGVVWGLALQLVLLATLALMTIVLERRRDGFEVDRRTGPVWRPISGPWPLLWGAVALAFLNFATLAVAGHPWSITFAFSLWGSKILSVAGWDVASWTFWTGPSPAKRSHRAFSPTVRRSWISAFLPAPSRQRASPGALRQACGSRRARPWPRSLAVS